MTLLAFEVVKTKFVCGVSPLPLARLILRGHSRLPRLVAIQCETHFKSLSRRGRFDVTNNIVTLARELAPGILAQDNLSSGHVAAVHFKGARYEVQPIGVVVVRGSRDTL